MAWQKPKIFEKEVVHLFNEDNKKLAIKLIEDFLENLNNVKVTRLGDTRILIENMNDMNYNLIILKNKHEKP